MNPLQSVSAASFKFPRSTVPMNFNGIGGITGAGGCWGPGSIGGATLTGGGGGGAGGGLKRNGLRYKSPGSGRFSLNASNRTFNSAGSITSAGFPPAEELDDSCGAAADGPGPWHLDLRSTLVEQARALGLRQVTASPWCSAHHRDRFYSHRASRGADGRMVAYLGLLAPLRQATVSA